MLKYLLLFFLLTNIFSCKPIEQKEQTAFSKQDSLNTSFVKPNANIRFYFTAKRITTFQGDILVTGTLYNDNADTVYFASSTCSGDQYLLLYDTAKFDLRTLVNCNASFPTVHRIAPHGQYEVQAYFRWNGKQKSMKLGFYFEPAEKPNELDWLKKKDPYHRSYSKDFEIWANEKNIE